MVTLITGKKGSGKTKKLIDLANKAVETSNGNVVVIEKGQKLTYDVVHKARLIDTEQYKMDCFKCFYGFVCGICAGNYDVTDIFVDSTLKIIGDDLNLLADFINKVDELSKKADTNFVISVSADDSELPESISKINRA